MQYPILCLMGPTASGKTDLALQLADHFPIEIINVDSAQIYKEMDIGAGKPSVEIRQKIPHHLMDILDPAIPYSAAQFRIDALRIIPQIIARGNMPVLVGGTYLYFKILQEGLSPVPASDSAIREKLSEKLKEQGLPVLYAELAKIDPQTAQTLQPTDPQRILRALEIYAISGKTKSQWLAMPRDASSSYKYINIALIPIETPRSVLHDRIALRYNQMLEQGFEEEVRKLFNRGDLNETMPSIRAVGYRQMWQYLSHQISYEAMRETAIAATRQLAKRQLTWLRQNPNVITLDFMAADLMVQLQNCVSKDGLFNLTDQ